LTEGFFYKGGISLKVAWIVQNYRKKRKDEFGNCLGLFSNLQSFVYLYLCFNQIRLVCLLTLLLLICSWVTKYIHGAIFLNIYFDLGLGSHKFHTNSFCANSFVVNFLSLLTKGLSCQLVWKWEYLRFNYVPVCGQILILYFF